jgi:hypothetical protein
MNFWSSLLLLWEWIHPSIDQQCSHSDTEHMTPETLYVNKTNSLNSGSLVFWSVTPSRNVVIQVPWGSLSISGVKAPWVSSLTSSSKRYCTSQSISLSTFDKFIRTLSVHDTPFCRDNTKTSLGEWTDLEFLRKNLHMSRNTRPYTREKKDTPRVYVYTPFPPSSVTHVHCCIGYRNPSHLPRWWFGSSSTGTWPTHHT